MRTHNLLITLSLRYRTPWSVPSVCHSLCLDEHRRFALPGSGGGGSRRIPTGLGTGDSECSRKRRRRTNF